MENVYTETFLSSPPRFIRLHTKSYKSLILIGCRDNIKYESILRNHNEDVAEIRHTCLGHYPVPKLCFYCHCLAALVDMPT